VLSFFKNDLVARFTRFVARAEQARFFARAIACPAMQRGTLAAGVRFSAAC
jgi:hypothetical protein